MKIIILIIWMTAVTCQGWAQINKTDSLSLKEHYLIKSQAQKKTAFILLGVGVACAGIGAIIASNVDENQFIDDNAITGGFLILGGGLSALASVPFFISSGANKNKARKLNAGVEMERAMPHGAFAVTYYPALSIKLSLK
jgi:hypothetical protein